MTAMESPKVEQPGNTAAVRDSLPRTIPEPGSQTVPLRPHLTNQQAKEFFKTLGVDYLSAEVEAYDAEIAHPEAWTVALLNRRPCRLWAVCPCGVQKLVDLGKLVSEGHGPRVVSALKLKCSECGGHGAPLVKWQSKAGRQCSLNLVTGEATGSSWRAAYPFWQDRKAIVEALAEQGWRMA